MTNDGWLLFNDGWNFALATLGESAPAFARYAPAEMPHDWLIGNAEDLYAPGVGWYRKAFSLPPQAGAQGRRVYLRFDGVYMDTTVYINGTQAYQWKYGYSTFAFDCTEHLAEGDNELTVRVCYQPPNSRWYTGAGIYRDVWLGVFPERHIVPDGVYVTPVPAADGDWRVEVDTELSGPWAGHTVRHCLYTPDGQLAAESQGKEEQVLHIKCPYLWDIASPALYRLESTLLAQEEPVQTVGERIGFRMMDYKPESGFWQYWPLRRPPRP